MTFVYYQKGTNMTFNVKMLSSCIASLPARAEDDLMSLQAALGADEGHVDEDLRLEQRLERLEDVRLVIVPSQGVMRVEGHPVGTARRARHPSHATNPPRAFHFRSFSSVFFGVLRLRLFHAETPRGPLPPPFSIPLGQSTTPNAHRL